MARNMLIQENWTTTNKMESRLSITSAISGTVIDFFVLPSVCFLGTIGNFLILFAYSCKRSVFKPSTFLIKGLAVADSGMCVTLLTYGLIGKPSHEYPPAALTALTCLTVFSGLCSTNTTLGIVLVRWIAITWPLRAHRFLTRKRTLSGYVSLIIWCLLLYVLTLCFGKSTKYGINIFPQENVSITVMIIGYVIPVFALILFNILLVRCLCQRGQNNIVSSSLNPRMSRERTNQVRRLVKAVICVGINTVIAYPLNFTMTAYIIYSSDDENASFSESCGGNGCIKLVESMQKLVLAINSSVNVIYYALFIKDFRTLLRNSFRPCAILKTMKCSKELGVDPTLITVA